MTSTRGPRQPRVLAWVGFGGLAAVLVGQVQFFAAVGDKLGDATPWLSGVALVGTVSLAAPAVGGFLGLLLGAPARKPLRTAGQTRPWVLRSLSHLLLGMSVSLTCVALVPALVGEESCIEECGFAALFYALTLGSAAAVAAAVGLLLYFLSTPRTAAGRQDA